MIPPLALRYEAAARKVALAFAGPNAPTDADYDAAAEYVDRLPATASGATWAMERWRLIARYARVAREERVAADTIIQRRKTA